MDAICHKEYNGSAEIQTAKYDVAKCDAAKMTKNKLRTTNMTGIFYNKNK